MHDSTFDVASATGERNADNHTTIVARATYQIFMVLMTLLALAIALAYYVFPLPNTVDQVLYIVDNLVVLTLLFDFFAHLFTRRAHIHYLLTYGWLDLLGALPGLPLLRLARLPGLMIMVRELMRTTPKAVRLAARQRLAESALLIVVLVVMIVIIIGSILIVLIEAPMPGANIKTGDDAVWWAIVTVSTVGYGDTYPMTPAGRLIGAAMIVMGVSLFSVLTSYIATQFMARRRISSVSEVELLRQEMRAAFVEFRRRAADENAALQAELTMLRRLLMEIADTTPPEA